MAAEHVPGPSPAYDPWQPGPRPEREQEDGVATAQHRPASTPGAPTRGSDGSWTLEVRAEDASGSGRYPQPRLPLGIATPSRGTPAQPTPPSPWVATGQRHPPRLGLVLGISIPVAVLATVTVAAALVVPGVLVDRDAQAAADDYAAQVADWESVYSDTALLPLTELDTASFDVRLATAAQSMGSGSYDDVAVDASGVRSACDDMADASDRATTLSASTPALRAVEGGDRNDAYARAVAAVAADARRYQAAARLADDLEAPFDAIGSACALVLAQADADAAFASAYATYLATLTVPQGGTERFDVDASRWIEFTCNATTGCASFVDRAARETTAAAWDAAFVTYDRSMARSYREHCPTASLQSTCDAWARMHDQDAQHAAAVSAAYRDEDVTGGAASGSDAIPAPDAAAALDAYVLDHETAAASATATTQSATGAATMLAAIAALVRGEGQTIRDAASAVRP